jgi:putative ABC transport system permease protein
MGASRAQIVSQLLVESVLLALLGGSVGLLLSAWPLQLLNGLSFINGPTGAPIFLDLRLDARVLTFTAAATMLTAVVFGLVPALQATRVALTAALKDPRSAAAPSRFRLGNALVTLQVCVSFVLLVGAVLLFRSLRNTERIEVGFDPDQIFIATVDFQRLGYDRARTDRFYAELLARARQLPGVERAALANFVPFGGTGGHPVALEIAGVTPPAAQRQLTVRVANVSDDYFATMGQVLTRGREFGASDRSGTHHVAIVNEAMARRYWPERDPIGKRFGLGEGLAEHEIVGVARDARFSSFGGDIEPIVFLPAFNAGRLHVRTTGLPADVSRSVRRIVQETDPNAVPYMSGQSMRESMASSMSLVPVKIARTVFAVAGVIALLLAAGGLYGLVSYTVEQRMKEIGIRVAMGANRLSVFRVIVGGTFRLTGVGLVVGFAIAAGVMHLLSRFLYGLSPMDPLTFGGIAALLALVTLGAGYTAARRGLDLDPMVILRYE